MTPPGTREGRACPETPSNARLVAELQALTIGIHLVGLDRLPEVMTASQPQPDQPA